VSALVETRLLATLTTKLRNKANCEQSLTMEMNF